MKEYIGSVLVVVYLSWLCSFCLDCYWYKGAAVEGGVVREKGGAVPPFPGKDMNNILWFIQLSDIHLSVHHDHSRISDLELFVKQHINTINPSLLLITGDLTDAKDKGGIFAKQFETEWKTYHRIMNSSPLIRNNKTLLIDVRGNHDAFDVHSQENDFFRQYGGSGESYNPVLLWQHKLSFGQYSFLAIDATPIPGPRRPYNFYGQLDKNELSKVERAMDKTRNDNMTFVLSHYPSSVITTDHPRLRRLLGYSIAHLCGHLHTVRDLAPKLYGRHPDGHLELELGDWKHHRRFRLLAIDHDILSFTDVTFNDCWPLILITNPTNGQFIVPNREPLARMLYSTHIRILVFSPFTVTQVTVSIDNGEHLSATPINNVLYTLPWKPSRYSSGIHSISVKATDSNGNEQAVDQIFTLDETRTPFELLPQFILLTDTRSLIRMTYFFVWLLLLVYLVFPWARRGCQRANNEIIEHKPVFIPLLVFIIYNGIGPLYMAEVLSDTYGLIWTHGVYVAGHFIPGSLTYLHSIVEICLFKIPLTMYLKFLTSRSSSGRSSMFWHTSYLAMMGGAFLYEMWGFRRAVASYGYSTILVSPGYSWGFPLAIVLIYTAFKRRRKSY